MILIAVAIFWVFARYAFPSPQTKTLMVVIALFLLAAPSATTMAQSKTTTPIAIEWTKVHEAEISATRYSVYSEGKANARKICHVYINDDGKTATVTLCVDWYSSDKKFVTRRIQNLELVKNKKSNWTVTKDARSGDMFEVGKRHEVMIWVDPSDEDLRWYFDGEFERAPVETRQVLNSIHGF